MLLPGDRKHEALMPVLGVKVNATIQSLRRFSVLGSPEEASRAARRRRPRRTAGDPDAVARATGRVPLRGEPAEGLGVPHLPEGAVGDPRLRADAGRRRRLPLRHLPGPAHPHEQRNGDARQVERPHRARRAVRSGARHVPGPDHRGDPRRRARRAAHRRGDGARSRPVAGRAVAPRRRDAEGPLLERRKHDHALRTRPGSRSGRSSATLATRTSGARSSGSDCGCRWRCRSCWSHRCCGTRTRGSQASSTPPTSHRSSSWRSP